MINRNAEALFWVGRYIERAENHARLIDIHYHIQHDGDFECEENKWARLIDALGARKDYLQQFGAFNEKDVLSFITLDRSFQNSLFSCVSQARNNLRTLREKLPSELWDMLNAFYLWLGEKKESDIHKESPHLFYKQIKERTAMFHGVEQSVILRGNEWHFIESGRYLERAENTVRILQSVTHMISEEKELPYPYLLAVLKSVSGYQAFRRFYSDAMSVESILKFLIGNEAFPRSVHFTFTQLEEHLVGLELQFLKDDLTFEKAIRQQASKVKADLGCLNREDLLLTRVSLLLSDLLSACQNLGFMMFKTYFSYEEATA